MLHRPTQKTYPSALVLIIISFGLFLSACNNDKKPENKVAVIRPVKTITVKQAISLLQKTYPAMVLSTQGCESGSVLMQVRY